MGTASLQVVEDPEDFMGGSRNRIPAMPAVTGTAMWGEWLRRDSDQGSCLPFLHHGPHVGQS